MSELGELNDTEVTEFVLIGFSGKPKTRMGLIAFMTIVYLVTVIGNGVIVLVVVTETQLHNPMYFFLCNLSILDICFSTSSVPQAIANALVDRPVMSFSMCYTQMYIGVYFGTTECFLLAVMAYDRYVAISNPLRYMIIMNWNVCIILAVFAWTFAFTLSILPGIVNPARFCGRNEVDHLTCEVTALLRLVCSDTSVNQLVMYFTSSFSLVFPFCFILFSYMRIIVAILRVHSSSSRLKAFSTCGSHLAVVCLYYGTCIFSYLKPQPKIRQERDKIISLFYGIVTPMLNPLIYTLRNQDVIGALKRLVGKKV
uniref:olfactory receptor 13H1-like n=1 Tax=Euleptes europaea TaxID=460621 RepID=UPI002541CEB2|nr:olfactory receptor 13H1-like [Euleptes europaea]XP_056722741.1 olfactory receptor 13H1-like [Euleptes europaea]